MVPHYQLLLKYPQYRLVSPHCKGRPYRGLSRSDLVDLACDIVYMTVTHTVTNTISRGSSTFIDTLSTLNPGDLPSPSSLPLTSSVQLPESSIITSSFEILSPQLPSTQLYSFGCSDLLCVSSSINALSQLGLGSIPSASITAPSISSIDNVVPSLSLTSNSAPPLPTQSYPYG